MYKTVFRAGLIYKVQNLFPLFVLSVLCFIGWKNFESFQVLSPDFFMEQGFTLSLIFALTFFNIFCESRKWMALVKSDELKIKQAFSAVLFGMCSGFVTPNRIGEFAGRSALLPKSIKKKSSVMTFAGSGIQGAVTVLFGIPGLLLFPILPQLESIIEWNPAITLIIIIAVATIFVFLWLHEPLKPKVLKIIGHLKSISTPVFAKAFFWGVLRYAVFTAQFALALYAFGYSGSLQMCLAGIWLLYFCQSYIPFTAMGELGVREILAIVIFGSFFSQPMYAAMATVIIWLANIGLPVLVGLIAQKVQKQVAIDIP